MQKSRAKGLLPLALACLSLALTLLFGTSRLDAQAIRLGVEFQVNSYTTVGQFLPSVSLDADGDFVVAWASVQDGHSTGVFARRFSSLGVAQAAEFQVNSYTVDTQERPSVSLDADGDFVVAWSSYYQDGSYRGVFARRFSSLGVAQAAEFRVNSYTTGQQSFPSVSLAAGGDFVVAWQSSGQDGSDEGVFARRFSSAGTAQAGEFQVSTYTMSSQRLPSVSLAADGDFVVAWQSTGQDGPSLGVFARRFSSAGTALAGEFQVSSYTVGGQSVPSVSLDDGGDFVVAWQSAGQDGSSSGVFARRFSSLGVAQAAELQVSSYTTGAQSTPSVSRDADGDFVVAWESAGQDGSSSGVFARRLSSLGVAQAAEFQVSSYTVGGQSLPSVSLAAGGDFVVAWESFGQDGSGAGIFAQRFGSPSPAVLDIDGDGVTGALTDGLLVLRYLFGFTGATLVAGAVDTGSCTRCDAAAIEGYVSSQLAAPTRLGVEFQVPSYTAGSERGASLSLDSDGDFVVAWESFGQDGSDSDVFARRFSSQGTALAGEFQVSSYATGNQYGPSVSLDADGDFVIAWRSEGQDGSDDGVFARRFSSQGTALAGEFQVSSYTMGNQREPSVSLDADGDFVIAWYSDGQDGSAAGVFARRFSSQGTALAGEFQVSSYTVGGQGPPLVSRESNGDFAVAWKSDGQDGADGGIFARRFSSLGAALAGELQVTSYTIGYQREPSVSLDADGDFVVAWESDGQDGSDGGIFARRFSSAGVPQAAEFQVTSYTTNFQDSPAVSLAAGGAFVVAWASNHQDGSAHGVFARRFSSAGVGQAVEFQVSTYTTGDQVGPAVSVDDGGGFVVAWESDGQDGSSLGIFAQRFTTPNLFDIDGNGATGALTDGLLVLRYLFGFTGAALVAGAVDLAGCTRCEAGPIEAYLQTLL